MKAEVLHWEHEPVVTRLHARALNGRLKALATEEGFTRRSCMLSISNYFIAISSANLMMQFRPRILFVVTLVVVSLSIANYVAFLRLKPEVSAAAWIANKTGYPSHVVAFHQLAVARVRPEASDAYLPIYDIRNPGFFMLVAELFVRAGFAAVAADRLRRHPPPPL